MLAPKWIGYTSKVDQAHLKVTVYREPTLKNELLLEA